MTIFSASISRKSIRADDSEIGIKLDKEAQTALGVYAHQLLKIYKDMMETKVFATDYTVVTEMDGTYDQIGDLIIHWREDGFIDVAAYENNLMAEYEMKKIEDEFAPIVVDVTGQTLGLEAKGETNHVE